MGSKLAEYGEACRDAEAGTYSPLGFIGNYIAEVMGVPSVGAIVQYLFNRTRRFPRPLLGWLPGKLLPGELLGDFYNHLTYLATE